METIENARERVAVIAEAHGEVVFAGEVRAGCWDHRRDVQSALRGERLKGETYSTQGRQDSPTSAGD